MDWKRGLVSESEGDIQEEEGERNTMEGAREDKTKTK